MIRTLAAGILIGAALGIPAGPAIINAAAEPLPACQYEDGNTDGLPCMWTSPRTGLSYYNDGSNYR